MTTDVIGRLPCPECGSEQELKSDGRKDTLKFHDCGLLAYYQTNDAKARIEQRLKEEKAPAVARYVALVLPAPMEGEQHFRLTIAPLPAALTSDAANDDDGKVIEAEPVSKDEKKGGFFEYFDTMFD